MTYGSQEGVARGYIPKRHHTQSSYAPILSSEGHSGLSLGAELRAGNVHPSVGAGEFVQHMLDKLPASIAASRTRVRLGRSVLRPEDHSAPGKSRLPLRRGSADVSAPEGTNGDRPLSGIRAAAGRPAEFNYTPWQWKQEHRFVAVRRPVSLEPQEIQLRLFTFKRYTYHRAIATNLELTPPAVWRFYCNRGFRNC